MLLDQNKIVSHDKTYHVDSRQLPSQNCFQNYIWAGFTSLLNPRLSFSLETISLSTLTALCYPKFQTTISRFQIFLLQVHFIWPLLPFVSISSDTLSRLHFLCPPDNPNSDFALIG